MRNRENKGVPEVRQQISSSSFRNTNRVRKAKAPILDSKLEERFDQRRQRSCSKLGQKASIRETKSSQKKKTTFKMNQTILDTVKISQAGLRFLSDS